MKRAEHQEFIQTASESRPTAVVAPPQLELEVSILQQTIATLRTHQRTDGYWWYALEANETIGSEFIFLMHYLGAVDNEIMSGIARRIRDVQRKDGTWALYNDGPADLSTTIECYFALKLAGMDPSHPDMARARGFILANGGIEKARVFTKIHLAMFGIVPWSSCPAMPAEFVLFPKWLPFNIYAFSSWARATIVPLLVFMSLRKVQKLSSGVTLDELFSNQLEQRDFRLKTLKSLFSFERFFLFIDKCLKIHEKIPFKPLRNYSINKALEWTWKHVQRVEDIYPALAYCALAFKAAGVENDDPRIRKPFEALKMFQQRYATDDVAPLPAELRDDGHTPPSKLRESGVDPCVSDICPGGEGMRIHQQCCISPCWDTPWTMTALLDAGVPKDDPDLLRAGRWLIAKQVTDVRGDWAVKNPHGAPGGWAFEFENDYFPDVDDTIQIVTVLSELAIPEEEKARSIKRGLDWLLSMQNDDGGWGAFDRNQTQLWVNRIPFSDHGACLDPSSPDITGRMIELLARRGFTRDDPPVRRALDYCWRTQARFGGWWARWGINYLYGTWCVLTGLAALGWERDDPRVESAVRWLISVQHGDGGFSESPLSYNEKRYVPLGESVPSQTAWALMGLVAGGRAESAHARLAAEYLFSTRNAQGVWEERDYTGTGFPGHFYIRYHGYRHFFPLLALARYQRALGVL